MNTADLLKKVRKIEIKARGLSQNIFAGQYHSAFKGRGMAFSEVREYQFGDDVRDIDWNVTARTARPYVKVYEEERELTVMLLVDVSGSLDFGTVAQQKRDTAAEIAATLAFSAIATGDKVGVVFFTDRIEKYIPPKKGRRHILRIISEMLDFHPVSRKTDMTQALEFYTRMARRRTTAFLLSDFYLGDELRTADDSPLQRAFSLAAHRHDLIAVQVYDPLARQLPNVGLLNVVDAETGHEMLIDTGDRRLREAHAAHWTHRQQRLTSLWNAAHVDNLTVATNEDYVSKLSGLFKQRLLGLLLLLMPLVTMAQTLEARLDSARIRIGSQTQLTLTVEAPQGTAIAFPDFEDKKEMTPGLEVVSTRTDTLSDTKVRRTYTLTAWDEQKLNVPALSVKAGAKTLKSKAIPIEVTTIKVDTAATAEPRPPHDVASNPFSWDDWSTSFWFTLVAAVLLAVVYYFSLRLKQNKPITPRIRFIRRLLPHQKAMQEIERLRQEPHEGEEAQKEYYTRLTDTLRQYLDERFGINAREMTSGEIIDRLREQDPERTDELREVFQTADLVKFARFAAESSEDDRYLQRVAAFIDDTKQENQPTVERVGHEPSARERLKAKERLGAILFTAGLAAGAVALLVAAAIKVADVLAL